MKCPITGVNAPRFLICLIIGFAFVFGFEFFWHGKFLMSTYETTPELWRPHETMQDYFHWNIMRIVLMVGVIAYIYTKGHEGKGILEGLRFGVLIGLLMGTMMASSYIWMPISEYLAQMWFVGGLGLGVGLGIINSLLYKPCGLCKTSEPEA